MSVRGSSSCSLRAARLRAWRDATGADELLGGTGLRSLEHFCTWQLGVSAERSKGLVAIARRAEELAETTALLREGRLSEDQVAVIAKRAPEGTDSHYAELAPRCTVSQLRRALRAAPKPEPAEPERSPEPENQVSSFWNDDDEWVCRARLSKVDGAVADAALRSHLDALVNEWKRAKEQAGEDADLAPFPTVADAFVRMCQHSLDAEANLRPHGHRTTVVMHLDLEARAGQLHLGPALSEAERRYLSCDARYEVWFERDGTPIGVGRTTREIPRRLRRALERRAGGCCEVPGIIRIVHGDGDVTVVDRRQRPLSAGGLARSPNGDPPPAARYEHPTGEPFDMRWYEPPSLC